MSTLSELLADHTELSGGTVEHLQRVVAEWQLLADMSFADFLLWIPLCADGSFGADSCIGPDDAFLCVAQARPTTGPTAHPEDAVGMRVTAREHPQLRRAVVEGRICREEDPAGTWRCRCVGDDPRAHNAVLAALPRHELAMPGAQLTRSPIWAAP